MKCRIHLGEMGEKTVCTTQIKLRTDWSMGDMKQKMELHASYRDQPRKPKL
jgi:hypothetical protein